MCYPSVCQSVPREEGTSGEVEESPLVSRLRLQLAQRERELHTREEELLLQHDTEVSSLRQENYLLQSKVEGPTHTHTLYYIHMDSHISKEHSSICLATCDFLHPSIVTEKNMFSMTVGTV